MSDQPDSQKRGSESAGVMLLYLMTTAVCGALLAVPVISYMLLVMSFGTLLGGMAHLGRITLLIMPGVLLATMAWWLLRRHFGLARDWLTPWNILGVWLGLLFVHTGFAFAFSNIEKSYHHGAAKPDKTLVEAFLWPLHTFPPDRTR